MQQLQNYVSNNSPQILAEEIYKRNLELLNQRRHAEQLLYGISEAVYAVDPNYNITLFNHTIEEMLNISANDTLDKNVDDVIKLRTEKGKKILARDFCFSENTKARNLKSVILSSQKKDYYVNISTSIINERGIKECLVTMVDITAEKELEKTKDDFISITSHELRTPMSIIKSYLWMLNSGKGGTLTNKQKEYLDKATKGTERMLNLINDMLNISKIEQGRMEMKVEVLNLGEFADDVLTDFKIKTEEKHIKLEIKIDREIHVYADKSKLREVLINLVGNSLKFTEQGSITVTAKKDDGNFVTISVTDTGKGLEKGELDKLFHKFGRLDNSYQTVAESGGTGLGLYIVKLLVESMGGKVGVHSDGKDKGSTFWFTLPINNIQEKLKLNVDLTKIQAI